MAKLEKIERLLFYVFLFLIPFQIKDVWSWGGSEWNSIFLYVTDGLFILILICWLARGFKGIKKDWILLLFLIVAGVSLFVSSNLDVSGYRFIKLFEFALLFLYIRANWTRNGFQILIASGVVQSILAIAQFLKQSSLGLGILEAGIFRPGIPGVATFALDGEKIMRAYGSFQHPNVLAGFLLLAIFCLYRLSIISNFKFQISNQFQITKFQNFILPVCLFILVFALFLTFSRVALSVFLVMNLIMFLIMILRKEKVLKLFGLFLVSCIICIAILSPYLKARFFTISLEEEAIDLRFFYNRMAGEMIKEKPFLGIGIGNFVNYSQNYPAYLRAASKMLKVDPSYAKASEGKIPDWLFQPVHNIYLLIGAEMGIIGLVFFLLFIGSQLLLKLRRLLFNPLFFLVICFLLLGLTDHYFWTLQSGGLIFWLSLGLLDS